MRSIFKTSLLVLSLSASQISFSETFIIGTNSSVEKAFPWLKDKVSLAFELAGHQVEYSVMSANQSLVWAASGVIDGDIMRQPDSLSTPHLLPIGSPVVQFEFWLIGHKELPLFETDDLSWMQGVGLEGVQFYDQFSDYSDQPMLRVQQANTVFEAIEFDQADFTVWSKSGLALWQKINPDSDLEVKLDEPVVVLDGYVYLNSRHHKYIDEITEAFSAVFN